MQKFNKNELIEGKIYIFHPPLEKTSNGFYYQIRSNSLWFRDPSDVYSFWAISRIPPELLKRGKFTLARTEEEEEEEEEEKEKAITINLKEDVPYYLYFKNGAKSVFSYKLKNGKLLCNSSLKGTWEPVYQNINAFLEGRFEECEFHPTTGETYFYIDACTSVGISRTMWNGSFCDRKILTNSGCFRTYEEALRIQELRREIM